MASLPPELRLQVFRHCSDLSSASNLAQSCKDYYETWSCLTEPICASILPRTVQHYDQALTLVQLQLNATMPPAPKQWPRLMLTNAKEIEKASATMMQDTYWFPHPCSPYLTPSESSRFSFAYYFMWILATTLEKSIEPLPDVSIEDLEKRYFGSLPNHDLYLTLEVAIAWVFNRQFGAHTSRESPNISLTSGRLQIGFDYCIAPSACPWEAAVWVIQQMAIRRAEAETPPHRLGKRYGMRVVLDENQDTSRTTYSDATFKRVVAYANRNWNPNQGKKGSKKRCGHW